MQIGFSEFIRIAGYFHQDIDLSYSSFQELLIDALGGLTTAEKRQLVAFLDDALTTKSAEELALLWHSSGAEVAIVGVGQLEAFLDVVRSFVRNSL